MARLEKKVLGEIRGKVGTIVGKMRNGKYYIASAPGKYRISQEPHEVDKRSRFNVNGKFAKVVRGSDLLYKVWEKEKAPATNAYNKICMVNFKLCRAERPAAENMITPGGFNLPVVEVKSFNDRIEAEISAFNLQEEEKRITLMAIVSFYEPEGEDNIYFQLSRLSNYEQEGLKFIFHFYQSEIQLAKAYKQKTIFLAAITENEKGNIIRCSKTFGKDL